MRVVFKTSFLKDIKKVKPQSLKEEIAATIKNVETATIPADIKNFKKLSGYKNYYRITIGDYRIGLELNKGIYYFVIFAHRKNIYRVFP